MVQREFPNRGRLSIERHGAVRHGGPTGPIHSGHCNPTRNVVTFCFTATLSHMLVTRENKYISTNHNPAATGVVGFIVVIGAAITLYRFFICEIGISPLRAKAHESTVIHQSPLNAHQPTAISLPLWYFFALLNQISCVACRQSTTNRLVSVTFSHGFHPTCLSTGITDIYEWSARICQRLAGY